MRSKSPGDASILITGGAGYIGSHVAWRLRDEGYRMIVLDDLSTGYRDVVHSDTPLIVADCGNGDVMNQLFDKYNPAAVIHFAGSISVPESILNPIKYYNNNTCKTIAVAHECALRGVPIVFSSTAAVYGAPAVDDPVIESSPTNPISPYGRSKLMAETILRDAHNADALPYVILRYFNVAGADAAGRAGQRAANASHLIRVACQTALGALSQMEVYGTDYATPDGTCIRDYIHVDDLALAHLLAVEHLLAQRPSMTLNCGYGRGYSVSEVIRAVERVSGRPVPYRISGRRDGDPKTLVANSDKIRSALGWRPQCDDLDTIVASAFAWEKRLHAI